MGRKVTVKYDSLTDVFSINFGKYGVSSLTEEPLDGIFLIYGYEKPYHQGTTKLVSLEHSCLSDLNEKDLQEVDTLSVPLIDIPEVGLKDMRLSDVLQWAYRTYFSKMKDREWLIALIQKLPDEKVREVLRYVELLQKPPSERK
jgi:hypothetical protein